MKRKFWAVVLALVLSQCLMACGGDGSSESYDSAVDSYPEEAGDSYDNSLSTQGSVTESDAIKNSNRKLVRTVSLKVETKEYDKLLVDLQKQIDSLNGYVENMSAYNQSWDYSYDDGRSATYTIRIPAESLNSFLMQVGTMVNIVEKTESVDDVTLSYVDMDSHVRMLKEEQSRLMEFLEQAQSIEEIITIENRLSEVKYQIESMSSQLRVMDNKVNYATVTIQIDEVVELTAVRELTTWERIATGFMENLLAVKEGLVEFFIWFVTHIPFIIIWVLLGIIVLIIIRISNKISKKNAEKIKLKRQAAGGTVFVSKPVVDAQKDNKNTENK